MANSNHQLPFRFVPHHRAPEHPGDDPLLFAFRGRELLVTEKLNLPSVSEIDAHGIEAVRGGFFPQYYVLPETSLSFLYTFALVAIFFGLALQLRYARTILAQ